MIQKIAPFLWGAIFVSVIFFTGCKSKVAATVEITDSTKIATITTENLSITYYENGAMSYRFTTPLMKRYQFNEAPYMEFTKGIKIETFNDSTKQKETELVADYAKYNEKDKIWEAKGNVVGKDMLGKTLLTEQLYWNEAQDKIYSNVDTKIVNGEEVTIGSGFVSDSRLDRIVFRRTKGEIYVDTTKMNNSAADTAALPKQ